MKHRILLVLAFPLILLFAQDSVALESAKVKVSPATVELGTFYGGAQIHVEGLAGEGSKIIVVVRGASGAEVFNKVGRMGPIWVNTGKVTVSAAPNLLLIFSSDPINACLNAAAIDQYQLALESLKNHLKIETKGADRDRIAADFLALKVQQGSYRSAPGRVRLGIPDQDGLPYTLDFEMPRSATLGKYQVTMIECRNGQVAGTWDADLAVVEVGFPELVAHLAKDHASLYGILSVVVAMIAGFGIDFIASRIFKPRVAAY
jgi:uncharacterized protein (TIGR02186 family)